MIDVQTCKNLVNQMPGIFCEQIYFNGDLITMDLSVDTTSSIEDTTLILRYELRVKIPISFPIQLPKVFDLKGQLDRRFEHVNRDGSLCLATDIDLKLRFQSNSPFRIYLGILLEYLTEYKYWKLYSAYPIEPRSHGLEGVYETYLDLFETDKIVIVKKLIMYIPVKNSQRNIYCPCGSGVKFKNCHFDCLQRIGNNTLAFNQIIHDLSGDSR